MTHYCDEILSVSFYKTFTYLSIQRRDKIYDDEIRLSRSHTNRSKGGSLLVKLDNIQKRFSADPAHTSREYSEYVPRIANRETKKS